MTADVITLVGVRAHGYHGVLEAERQQGQAFVVDVELHIDTRKAAATDDLSATVDYAAVAAAVVAVIEGEPVSLIETLADRIASRLLEDLSIEYVRVTVHKPQAPVGVPFEDVRVSVVRP